MRPSGFASGRIILPEHNLSENRADFIGGMFSVNFLMFLAFLLPSARFGGAAAPGGFEARPLYGSFQRKSVVLAFVRLAMRLRLAGGPVQRVKAVARRCFPR
jgi:hypothetical protein